MNISYNWLKEYLDFDLQPEEVAAALTSIGLETGGVEEVQTIKGGLEGDGAGGGEGHQAGPELEPAQLLDTRLLLVLDVVVVCPLLFGLDQAAILTIGEVGAFQTPAQNGLQ